jgi:uncharacterized membrane protein
MLEHYPKNFWEAPLEGTLLAVAAGLVATLVVWMGRASRSIKHYVETRLETLTGEAEQRQGWGLLGFTFFMVFREGVEIVLFLAALSLTATSNLLQLIGGVTGLALAALFGFLLIKGSVRIDLRRFFGLTGLVLVILVVRLLAGSIHEFSEVGLLPSTPTELAIIGFLVKDTTSLGILMALIVLPVLAMLPGLRGRPEEEAPLPNEGPAERRKRVAALRRARRWQIGVIGITLVITLSLASTIYATAAAAYRPQPAEVAPRANQVHIPTASLEVGRLHKFLYYAPTATVRFIVIKRDEDDFAVALDACGICPPAGYHQEGDTIICDNCNAPINLDTIGMPGGCNPIPLAARLDGGDLVINLGDLEAAQGRFAQ